MFHETVPILYTNIQVLLAILFSISLKCQNIPHCVLFNTKILVGFKAINAMCPLIVFYWIHYIDNTYTALVSDHKSTYSAFERENNLSLCLQENELRPAGYCYIAATSFFPATKCITKCISRTLLCIFSFLWTSK